MTLQNNKKVYIQYNNNNIKLKINLLIQDFI